MAGIFLWQSFYVAFPFVLKRSLSDNMACICVIHGNYSLRLMNGLITSAVKIVQHIVMAGAS